MIFNYKGKKEKIFAYASSITIFIFLKFEGTVFLQTLHGYVSSDTISITIPLEAPVLTRNQANEALIDSLNDCLKMLRYFENLITKWLLKLTKYGCEGEMVIRDAIETRAKLKSEIGK